jgi:two-component system cell cycle response regulator DivK
MDKQTVLIAEDSSVIQNLTKKILEQQNLKVLTAKNGKEVLALLETEPVHLILMDINMPQMDGITCVQNIRSSTKEEIKNIPVLAITGNARNYTEEEFKDAGINEFLQKPVDFDHLVEVVKRWL